MAYQSLYRKYRPQTFSDVVGQGHVGRTLQNALASGRIAHGYLFTGTRGTAKTTIARILAKALNCESEARPVPEPCNRCAACTSITSGSSIDVIEMDAASHRGVADIEEVRKAVGYGPMELRYKVFIIDEAHQLSLDAKDAFLKTLEEPPDNVVFILATTEPQAIPITIRSRCQQFDFKRGSLTDIVGRLRYVLDCEGVTYTPEAVNLIARGAEGSYRDSLSLLEQVLAFSPRHITTGDVDTVLGTLDSEMLTRVTEAVARNDAPGTFALAGELLDAGKEARTLLKTLSAHFRDLLLVSVGGPAVAAELAPEEVGKLQVEARQFTPQQMMRAIEILNEAQGETRWNNQHRLLVELTFLKLMSLGAPTAIGTSVQPPAQFLTAPIVFAPKPEPQVVASETKAASPPPTVVSSPPPPPVEQGEDSVLSNAPTLSIVAKQEEPSAPVPPAAVIEVKEAPAFEVPPPGDDDLPADYFAADDLDDEDDFSPTLEEEDAEDEPTSASPTVAMPIETPPLLLLSEEEEEDEAAPDEGPIPAPFEGPNLFDALGGEEAVIPTVTAATPEIVAAAPVEPSYITAEQAPPSNTFNPLATFEAPTPTVEKMQFETPPVMEMPQAPAANADVEEDASDEPVVTIEQVWQIWSRFLRDAEKISMRAKVLMEGARPTEVVGRTVVISFPHRMNFEMMEAPDKREFVRKLLARTLGPDVNRLQVRFVLDGSAPPAPTRSKTKKKIERNPLAEVDRLDSESTSPHSTSYSESNGSGSHFRTASPPAPAPFAFSAPVGAAIAEDPKTGMTGQGRGEYAPSPGAASSTRPLTTMAKPIASGADGHPLEDHPLVQEARSIFGGVIVTDE